jgi:hypothetical protein
MVRYIIAAAAILGCALADDSAYAAPSASYSAADSGYAAPQAGYGAPSVEYGAPSAPSSYDATGYEYTAAQEDDSGFDLSKITELLPLFLAVFAAIIVAQLFAPLLGALFGAKLNLASGILAPLSAAKIDVINAILSPFNLVLGNIGTCTAATGRSLGSPNFSMSPDSVLDMLMKANEIYNGYSS